MPSYVNRALDLASSLASDIANDEHNLTAVERFSICLRTGHFDRAHNRHQAGLLIDAGCYEAALPLFEQNGVWRKAGDCLWALGRLDDALRAYSRPGNRSDKMAFRSGPDHDRLMALAALCGQWQKIPELLKDGKPGEFSKKDVFFGGSARAKGPLLRLLALAVRHGAADADKRLLAAFNVDAGEWAAILSKEEDRTEADVSKQLDKLRPGFLRVPVATPADAARAGATEHAERLVAYIAAVEDQFPTMVASFKDWQATSDVDFLLSVVYWLTESGSFSMFRSCLHSLRCEVDSWTAPGLSDARFYAAHPWIVRACSDELVRACLSEAAAMSAELMVSALMQHLSMDLALDLEGDKPGHQTFARIKGQPGWATSKLGQWMKTDSYGSLFGALQKRSFYLERFQKLHTEPTWIALMCAAAAQIDTCWSEDFSETRWQSEHALFLRVKDSLAPAKVEQHASPVWLSPQHLDIFLPDQKIAVEYQGQQHYMPIDIFGGEAGFIETVRRDEQKRRLCRIAGITLIEVVFDDDIEARVREIADLARARDRDRHPNGPRPQGLGA